MISHEGDTGGNTVHYVCITCNLLCLYGWWLCPSATLPHSTSAHVSSVIEHAHCAASQKHDCTRRAKHDCTRHAKHEYTWATYALCGTVATSPGLHTLSFDKYLLRCRCVIVTKLPVTYRLPTAGGVTISQPQRQAAALQDNDLYVEVDRLDSYTHILPELTRLFSDGVKDPDMAQFLITLILTMVCVTLVSRILIWRSSSSLLYSQWCVSHHICKVRVCQQARHNGMCHTMFAECIFRRACRFAITAVKGELAGNRFM